MQEPPQRVVLGVAQRGEELGLCARRGLDRRGMEIVPGVGETEHVAPPVGTIACPRHQSPILHRVDEADDDRRIESEAFGELLLGESFCGADEAQHEELTPGEMQGGERRVEHLAHVVPRP